jgi:hypothetical protein
MWDDVDGGKGTSANNPLPRSETLVPPRSHLDASSVVV